MTLFIFSASVSTYNYSIFTIFFLLADEFIRELLTYSDMQQPILTGLVGLLKPDDTGRALTGTYTEYL